MLRGEKRMSFIRYATITIRFVTIALRALKYPSCDGSCISK